MDVTGSEPSDTTPSADDTPGEATARPKATVLLVDDQKIIAQAVRGLLKPEADIEFHHVADPTAAIATANRIEPTVILQDLVMPQVDGLTLVKYFRANPKTRDVPLIVLSTKEEAEVKAKAFAVGANDYMVKLPDAAEVIARVRYHSEAHIRLLERNQAFESLREAHARESRQAEELARFNERLEEKVRDATRDLQLQSLVLERRVEDLSGLRDVALAMNSIMQVNQMLATIMDLSKKVMKAEASSLLLLEGDELRFHVAQGGAGDSLREARVPLGQGFAGIAAQTGESLLVPDAYADPRFNPDYDRKTGFKTRSLITAPMKKKGEVIGVVQVVNRLDGTSFTREDVDVFEAFANMAGISLHNAELFEKTRRMADDLRDALEQERRLSIEKTKMGAYLPKQVVDEIERSREEKLALGGKLVTATVMFSDIKGFTRFSETLEPQRVVAVLNRYMTAMADIIEDENGVVDKFMGDGIMAIYMSHDGDDHHAVRAVRAAGRMQQAVAGLRAEWATSCPEAHDIAMRIGINTGEMVAGNVGSATRMDYTVIGDNVNVASRVESHGASGQVHISESTHSSLGGAFATTRLQPISVKNRAQPVRIYRVDYAEPEASARGSNGSSLS